MHPRKPPRRILLLLALVVGLAALALGAPSPSAGEPVLTVTFLDVGQGDAIWIQTPNGDDILVDGGPPAAGEKVLSYLQAHGCTGIEFMVLTHPHEDHVGGLVTVLERLPTDEIWYTGEPCPNDACTRFLSLAASKGLTPTIQTAGASYIVGAALLEVLNPATLGPDPNENSLVCRLSVGSVGLLLTADIGAATEEAILRSGCPLQAEILKVAHHGSGTSSSALFLQAVSPEVAVISVGAGNVHGHPSAEVLSRLAGVPARVYRTDRHGAVAVVTNGTTYSVYTPERWVLYLPLTAR